MQAQASSLSAKAKPAKARGRSSRARLQFLFGSAGFVAAVRKKPMVQQEMPDGVAFQRCQKLACVRMPSTGAARNGARTNRRCQEMGPHACQALSRPCLLRPCQSWHACQAMTRPCLQVAPGHSMPGPSARKCDIFEPVELARVGRLRGSREPVAATRAPSLRKPRASLRPAPATDLGEVL